MILTYFYLLALKGHSTKTEGVPERGDWHAVGLDSGTRRWADTVPDSWTPERKNWLKCCSQAPLLGTDDDSAFVIPRKFYWNERPFKTHIKGERTPVAGFPFIRKPQKVTLCGPPQVVPPVRGRLEVSMTKPVM